MGPDYMQVAFVPKTVGLPNYNSPLYYTDILAYFKTFHVYSRGYIYLLVVINTGIVTDSFNGYYFYVTVFGDWEYSRPDIEFYKKKYPRMH